jgi:hypothetical protein
MPHATHHITWVVPISTATHIPGKRIDIVFGLPQAIAITP